LRFDTIKGSFQSPLAWLAIWINSQLEHVLQHVIKLPQETPRVSIGSSP